MARLNFIRIVIRAMEKRCPYVSKTVNPVGIYLLKVNNRNTRTRCEICSKLTIKTPERG